MSAHTDTPLPDLTRAESEDLLRTLSDRANRRRRGRFIARFAVTLFTVGLLGGTLTWALVSLGGLGEQRTPGSGGLGSSDAADEAQPYRFERIRVVYPYVQPVSEDVVEGSAGVDVDVEWPSSTYPGEHECQIDLFDAAGELVGSVDTQLSTHTPQTNDSRLGPLEVGGRPVSATIFCDPERLDAPVAFAVSDESIEPIVKDDRVVTIAYTYTVDAPPSVSAPLGVGTNWCRLTISGPSGEVLVDSKFTLDTPTPNTFREEWNADDRFASFSTTQIEAMTLDLYCEPFTGAPGQQG